MKKDRSNSYINVYNKLFASIKDKKISLLEIYREDNKEINFWDDYFKNGEIYGINKKEAYEEELKFNKKKFNIIIENCSYDLDTLIKFINEYLKHLTHNGILIIQNIQSIRYIKTLLDTTPSKYQKFIEAYDLRTNNENYDDVIFIINKTNNDEKEEEVAVVKKEEPIVKKVEKDVKKEIYDILFRRKKNNELILLNIGLHEDNIRYLIDYFNKSLLFGIGSKKDIDEEFKNNIRIKLYLDTNPLDINLESSNIRFDVIICNYENDVNRIVYLINTYSRTLNTNGLLIIEDVDEEKFLTIREMINPELKDIIESYKDIIIINK